MLFLKRSLTFIVATVLTAYPQVHSTQMASLHPTATFRLGGDPDWMAISDDAVRVTTSKLNQVTQLLVATNTIGLKITVADPCSGLIAAFGSLWIPSCGSHSLVRADLKTAMAQATIPAAPADSEGCIAANTDSIWLATSAKGVLSRIDPKTNSILAEIAIPSGSFCPVFADNFVWITSTQNNLLTKVDPSTNKVLAQIKIGKNPRFASAGAGSIWTLNQGDGTISRVDTKTGKLLANIPAQLVGHGGEITFGFGSVWATLIGTPVTRIDAASNAIVHQRKGAGGDSIRAGHGSIWLTDLKAGAVWRFSPSQL
ncbi:MAG TPA: hypothetical protein VH088_12350 [Terriglobales bacterium]|jgi:YVTN family beta-propeller protein|nr:hypothetical protein [Terriglobales bacterium]